MSTRFKPGTLAIIIRDVPQCAANIGRIVELSGPPAYDHDGRITWLIQPVTSEPYLINTLHDDSVRFMEHQEQGIEHAEEWMTPIEAAPKEETVMSREHEPAEID